MTVEKRRVTPEIRDAIRKAYGDGSRVSLADVARQFGFSVPTISNVVNNHTRARAILAQAEPAPGAEGE